MSTTIHYHMPKMGKLKIELYGVAEKFYKVLESNGYIDKLKSNAQLGVIQNVCEGSHHTRWEYVVTQLYLINCIQSKGPKNLGLANNSPNIGKAKVSGTEILQVWVLLFNIGHMIGTFASEKGFLMHCKENKETRKLFLRGINDLKVRDIARIKIKDEKLFFAHKMIAFFILGRLRGGCFETISKCEDIGKAHIIMPQNGIERLRKLNTVFSKLRALAILYLDSNYGYVPLTFDLNQIIFDFEKHSEEIFIRNDSEILRSILTFHELLTENFYMAPEVLYCHGKQAEWCCKKLEKHLSSPNTAKIYQIFKDDSIISLKNWNHAEAYNFRLWVDSQRSISPIIRQYKENSLEEEWNSRLPSTRCRCTVEKSPGENILAINIAIYKSTRTEALPRLFSLVIGRLFALQKDYMTKIRLKKTIVTRGHFTPACKEMMLRVLHFLWGKHLLFCPSEPYYSRELWFMENGSTKASQVVEEYKSRLEERGVSADRLHELEALSRSLRSIQHRGTVLVTTSQIVVRKCEDYSDVTDLDGVVILADSKELSLVLVEAKKLKKRPVATAIKRIKSTLTAMGFDEGNQPDIHRLERFGAYTVISLYSAGEGDGVCQL